MPHYYYNEGSGQYLFDRVLQGLWITVKWLFKAALYFPLWFTGYVIATGILNNADSAFAWIGIIVLSAVALYQLVYFIKGMVIAFMNEGHFLLGIPLLILCISFTCIFPLWVAFDSIKEIAFDLTAQAGNTLTWIFVFACGLILYSRYHFLTNIAPVAAYPAYQLGIDAAFSLLRISSNLDGEKSRQLI